MTIVSDRGYAACEQCGCEIGSGLNPRRFPVFADGKDLAFHSLAHDDPDLAIDFADGCHCHDAWIFIYGRKRAEALGSLR